MIIIYKCTNKGFFSCINDLWELYTIFIQSLFLFYNGCFNSIRHKGELFKVLNWVFVMQMKVINDIFPLKNKLVLFFPSCISLGDVHYYIHLRRSCCVRLKTWFEIAFIAPVKKFSSCNFSFTQSDLAVCVALKITIFFSPHMNTPYNFIFINVYLTKHLTIKMAQ